MSEPPPSNDDDPSKKGKRKNPNTYAQKGLGSFGIKRSKKIVHRGEVEVVHRGGVLMNQNDLTSNQNDS
jgi:hypothetical protein